MDRLTKKEQVAGHEINYVGDDHCFDLWSVPKKFLGEAIDRLAAYEDTGLGPNEITTEPYGCVFYCNRKCNLDGDFCAEGPGCPYEINAETAKHLLELAQAEKDGRLVMLPGKFEILRKCENGSMKRLIQGLIKKGEIVLNLNVKAAKEAERYAISQQDDEKIVPPVEMKYWPQEKGNYRE